ncbi:transcription antitermination factor NusB [Rubrimonas cliftonensis]|uniref:16S rRNA (Cytosine967-C5)-methyltransferase n=1 Tax=Rubrimonas cliftonensis TaxID=89524 RepID=A0A1H3VFR8_9RHOB|nr:transcription antitermination factor NusB [Rubrimonas cliftonensis]SDZ73511.1 16S rRNA (cytosine967-C5)-methyltransferase [Rubrimonas cliftonensis]
MSDVHGLAPRRAALRLVSHVLDDGRSLDAAKADAGLAALTGPERARAGDLAAAVLRWLGPVDALLAELMRAPIEAKARAARDALRLAVAEVGALGVAPHAAVDAAVRLTKEERRSAKLSGLVNAVARRATEAAPVRLSGAEAAKAATPAWLRRRLVKAYGAATTDAMAAAQLKAAPLDLTPRDRAETARWAEALGAEILPTGTLRLGEGAQITAAPGYAEGAWWAQDAAAALPARLFGPLAGRRALDLCAAPGGKTMQLAAMGAEVTALDMSAQRLERLRENLARTGLRAEVVAADAREWRPEAPFDAVLLDAPCTGVGTLRRHPDIAHLRRESDVAQMAALQDALLDAAWSMVAPGGSLVFCTCSLLPEEGEARARGFAARTPDARPTPATAEALAARPEDVEVCGPLVDRRGWLRCRPDLWPDLRPGGLDGFFAARFDKPA